MINFITRYPDVTFYIGVMIFVVTTGFFVLASEAMIRRFKKSAVSEAVFYSVNTIAAAEYEGCPHSVW